MSVRYELWDVFTTEPFRGNPLAVVPDARGLSDMQMQRTANEFNLSETSFVLPSETAETTGVRARYFTPAQELPMAGHPSIGTVFALEKAGAFASRDRVTLTLNVGPVEMTLGRDGETLKRVWMNQGVPELSGTFDRAQVARALGLAASDLEPDLPVQLGSAGNPFLLVPVVSLDALERVQVSLPELSRMLHGDHRGVFLFTRNTPESDLRARMFGVTNRPLRRPPRPAQRTGRWGHIWLPIRTSCKAIKLDLSVIKALRWGGKVSCSCGSSVQVQAYKFRWAARRSRSVRGSSWEPPA